MTNFEADRFVGAEAYDLPTEKVKIAARLRDLRCIDGRDRRRSNGRGLERLPSTAFPGAGLGFFMDVVSGLRALPRPHNHSLELTMEEVLHEVRQVVGPLSLHTDDHHESSGDHLSCAGCGYCQAALAEPELFGLREADAYFVRKRLLPDLSRHGIKGVVLSGEHEEKGVIVVDAEDLGLPSVSEDGQRAFVYHRTLHEMALRLVAEKLLKKFPDRFVDISSEELGDIFVEAAGRKLRIILGRLAADKPLFRAYRSEAKQVLVEPVSANELKLAGEEDAELGDAESVVR